MSIARVPFPSLWLVGALFVSVTGEGFDLSSVVDLLNNKELGIQSIDQLTDYLPPEYKSNYVRVYDSRSEFKSTKDPETSPTSKKYPRIISYGKTGRFIISYRGNPKHPESFNKLQMLRYNEADPKSPWELYEIGFPPKRDKEGKVISPEKNPLVCLECHGDPPHPIWDSYFLWAGVLGSEDDFLMDPETRKKLLAGGIKKEKFYAARAKESEFYGEFLKVKDELGRYRNLGEHFEPIGKLSLDGKPYNGKDRKVATLPGAPNATLSILLTHLHTNNLARRIADETKLFPFRYMVLGALTCRRLYDQGKPFARIEDFLPLPPSPLRARFAKDGDTVLIDTLHSNRKALERKVQRHLKLLGMDQGQTPRGIALISQVKASEPKNVFQKNIAEAWTDVEAIARLRFLLEPLGLDYNWSLERVPSFNVADGSVGFSNNLERQLVKNLISEKSDPELYKLYSKANSDSYLGSFGFGEQDSSIRKQLCEKLVNKSRDALTEFEKAPERSHPTKKTSHQETQ